MSRAAARVRGALAGHFRRKGIFMLDRKRSFVGQGLLVAAALAALVMAGCKHDDENAGQPGGGPPAAGGPGGRRMGGPGGGRGGPVAANASASEIFQQKCSG